MDTSGRGKCYLLPSSSSSEHDDDLYIPLDLLSLSQSSATVRFADGRTMDVSPTRVRQVLPEHLEGCPDLLHMRDFSEPALVQTIRTRFHSRQGNVMGQPLPLLTA